MIASDVIIINCGTHMIVDGERYLAPTAYHITANKPAVTMLYKHIEYRPLPSLDPKNTYVQKPTNTSNTHKSSINKYTPGQFREL